MGTQHKIGVEQIRTTAKVTKIVTGEKRMAEQTETLALVDKSGSTRGKNPRPITFKILNRIPKSVKEFYELFKDKDESKEENVVEYLYEGFNSLSYSAASDEIGEFIPDTGWGLDKEMVAQFRLAVRNLSKVADMSIEEVAGLIGPKVEKAFVAKMEKAKADAEAAKNAPATPAA